MRKQATFMDRVRAAPTWLKIVVPAVLVGIVVASAAGGNGRHHSASTSARGEHHADAPTHNPRDPAEERHHEAIALRESIESAVQSEGSPTIRCAGQTNCGVTYDVGEIVGIDTEEELLDDQRDVWAAMFADPKFQSGFVELEATIETAGGKTLTDPVLRVRCDRAAARQIDWTAVRAEGFRQLCRWEELIGF